MEPTPPVVTDKEETKTVQAVSSLGESPDHVSLSGNTLQDTAPLPSHQVIGNLPSAKDEDKSIAPPMTDEMNGPVTMASLNMVFDRFSDNISQLVTVQMSQVESRIRTDFGMVLDRVDREYVPKASFAALQDQVESLKADHKRLVREFGRSDVGGVANRGKTYSEDDDGSQGSMEVQYSRREKRAHFRNG